jgi:hypothetical protein
MDHIAPGVASAALTLQSIRLQALVHKGVLTPAEALGAIDQSLDAVANSVRTDHSRCADDSPQLAFVATWSQPAITRCQSPPDSSARRRK